LPVYLVAIISAICGSWILAFISSCVCVVHLCWVLPDFLRGSTNNGQVVEDSQLRVFSSNLLMVNKNWDGILQEIKEHNPDVILLQEYSHPWHTSFENNNITNTYPHTIYDIRDDSFGVAIYSRLPLNNATIWFTQEIPVAQANVRLRCGREIVVMSLHPLPPRTLEYTAWCDAQMHEITKTVSEINVPLLIAGDFNGTQHNAWVNKLSTGKMRSCHEDRGRGSAVTFPNGVFPLPPVRLDHIFISKHVACLSIQEGIGAGSDHRPLITNVALFRQI